MKVNATYRVVFNVTREVEVPEEEFDEWATNRYEPGFDREFAIAGWLDHVDEEFNSAVFSDWQSNEALPEDFELQYVETEDVTFAASQDASTGENT